MQAMCDMPKISQHHGLQLQFLNKFIEWPQGERYVQNFQSVVPEATVTPAAGA